MKKTILHCITRIFLQIGNPDPIVAYIHLFLMDLYYKKGIIKNILFWAKQNLNFYPILRQGLDPDPFSVKYIFIKMYTIMNNEQI